MIRLAGAGYRYPSGVVVGPVDLAVAPGELVLLTGPTGCGKSTVLRLAAGLVQRHGHGEAFGRVEVGVREPGGLVAAERVGALGFVGQEPDDQVIAGTLAAEVGFGPESAGLDAAEIDRRVAEALARVGLAEPVDRAPMALSGGQRQRLVLAAALAGGGRALLLDEPLSQLDPLGAARVMDTLRGLADAGMAVLVVEHRLEQAAPRADRVVVMAEGRVVADPLVDLATLRRLGIAGPAVAELEARVGPRAGWVVRGEVGTGNSRVAAPAGTAGTAARVELDGTEAGYGGAPVLRGVSLRVGAGERVAVLGGNGAGKSTLLGVIAGRVRARGRRVVAGRVVAVPQNPDLALFCGTVAEELAYAPEELGVDPGPRVEAAARALSVEALRERPPQALSRGQRLRVAVAAALTAAPDVLLLDEPTSGQDREQVERMFAGLAERLGDGALLFATHDVDLALRHATRVLVLDAGRVVADLPPTLDALGPALAGLPLLLPPLAEVCLSLGLPYASVDTVAAALERGAR